MMTVNSATKLIEAVTEYKDLAVKRWNRLSELLKDPILHFGSDKDWFKSEMEKTMKLIVAYEGMIEKAQKDIDYHTEDLLKAVFKDDYIEPKDRKPIICQDGSVIE